MNANKLLVSVCVLYLTSLVEADCQLTPTLALSTLCVGTNEHLYIVGSHLAPGARVDTWIAYNEKDGPIWAGLVDTNGNILGDVTYRGNFSASGPPFPQLYHGSGGGASYQATVWYQTSDQGTNRWYSNIRGLSVSSSPLTINADIVPYNSYQVQMTTNMGRSWQFIGTIADAQSYHPGTPVPWPVTNFTFSLYPPSSAQMYFRIANPYGPCPCSFTNTSN